MRGLYFATFADCWRIADFGCSSGPNTLQFVSEIMDVIHFTCKCLNKKEPIFQVFLNDLPGNDFNTIFRSLPSFYEKLDKEKGRGFGPCFKAGMPGTFYGRLFPDHFLHFARSSYSLQWRSQVGKLSSFLILPHKKTTLLSWTAMTMVENPCLRFNFLNWVVGNKVKNWCGWMMILLKMVSENMLPTLWLPQIRQ